MFNRKEFIKQEINNRRKSDENLVASTYSNDTNLDSNDSKVRLINMAKSMVSNNTSEKCPVTDLSQCPILETYPQISCNKCNKALRDEVCNNIIENYSPLVNDVNKEDDSSVYEANNNNEADDIKSYIDEIHEDKLVKSFDNPINNYQLESNPILTISTEGIIDICPSIETAISSADKCLLDDPSINAIWIYKPIKLVKRTTVTSDIIEGPTIKSKIESAMNEVNHPRDENLILG